MDWVSDSWEGQKKYPNKCYSWFVSFGDWTRRFLNTSNTTFSNFDACFASCDFWGSANILRSLEFRKKFEIRQIS